MTPRQVARRLLPTIGASMPAVLLGGAFLVPVGVVALGPLPGVARAVTGALAGLVAVGLAVGVRSRLRRGRGGTPSCRSAGCASPYRRSAGCASPYRRDGGADRATCQSVLLRALCHELRSPISALTALTRTLADERQAISADDRRAMLSLARDQAAHLDGVWRQAVAWTLGVTGGADPPVPLARMLPAVVTAWPPDRVRLSVSPAAGRWPVDAQRVRQVLLNLVGNALRHGPRSGRVSLTATVRAGNLVMVVADEGRHCAGLRAALRRSAPPSGLSGLGLWIVRRLVDADGGTIRAYPLRPRGVAVEVSWPAGPARRPASARGAALVRRPARIGRALRAGLARVWPGLARGRPGRA